ncbi:MAG: type II toxin-antitoxin system VapB family antitoxin [Phycisphaerae bacterium]|nr:type II toxin-antitoxin system VapB family antitoxin [Gemmatimonadaceae bacterium]
MAVNIKIDRVEELLDELAALTGESKTQTIRRALEERRDRLVRSGVTPAGADRLQRLLESEIWPSLSAGVPRKRISKAEEEAILGYGPDGV